MVFVLTVIEPEVTWKVTGIVNGLLASAVVPSDLVAVMVIVPEYVPAGSELGCAVTVMTLPAAVVPESGPANSQLMPLAVPLKFIV